MTSVSTSDQPQRPAEPPRDLYPYFQTIDDLPQTLDWSEWFEQEQPVELDIGCGRGLFLVSAAVAQPDRNFLGLEIDFHEGRRSARKLAKRQLPNARVVGGDCRQVLQKHIKPGTVSAAHVYFPDPWWKRRHHKRRLFTDEFADLLAVVLQPGGLLHSWTDVADYFTVIQGLMDHHARFQALPAPAERRPTHDLDYRTSFERKKRQAGLPIYRGLWQKLETEEPVGE